MAPGSCCCRRAGNSTTLASLLDYEESNNPDADQSYGFLDLAAGCLARVPADFQPRGGIVDSNASKVAALSPFSFAAVDAAGNDILRVTVGQDPEMVAVLPGVPQRISPGAARQLGLPARRAPWRSQLTAPSTRRPAFSGRPVQW